MIFTIFRKTCELTRVVNGEEEWDGDDGYFEEVEIPDTKVKSTLADLLIDTYAKEPINEVERQMFGKILCEIIDDYNLLNELKKEFDNELKERYEQ